MINHRFLIGSRNLHTSNEKKITKIIYCHICLPAMQQMLRKILIGSWQGLNCRPLDLQSPSVNHNFFVFHMISNHFKYKEHQMSTENQASSLLFFQHALPLVFAAIRWIFRGRSLRFQSNQLKTRGRCFTFFASAGD